MKSIFLSLLLFALIASGTVWSTVAVTRRADALCAILSDFPSPESEGTAKQEATKALLLEWERARPVFSLSVMRSLIREADCALCRLQGATETEDAPEYARSLSEVRRLLLEIRTCVLPTLSYIL